MKIVRAILFGLLAPVALHAHDIITTNLTFTRDISRILARRCQTCHAAQAPIPLITYEETRPWAVSIKEQVLSRQMPPWGAVKGFGHLSPDSSLTQEEIMVMAAWVVGGAPKGNPAFLPAPGAAANIAGEAPALKDGLLVTTRVKIEQAIKVSGIRPLAQETVDSTRIIANLPGGRVEPLLWLFRYNPAGNRIFRFRQALLLPAGSVVESNSPLRFALETLAASSNP